MSNDIERSIRALPHDMQDRMARLVLGGWVFEPASHSHAVPTTSVLGWRAKHTNVWKKLYASSTLLTLLYQMEGVVEDTEAGCYEFPEWNFEDLAREHERPVPDAATREIGKNAALGMAYGRKPGLPSR